MRPATICSSGPDGEALGADAAQVGIALGAVEALDRDDHVDGGVHQGLAGGVPGDTRFLRR